MKRKILVGVAVCLSIGALANYLLGSGATEKTNPIQISTKSSPDSFSKETSSELAPDKSTEDSTNLRLNEALAAIEETNLAKAEAIFTELISKQPSSAAAKYGLGVVKALEGKSLESVEQLHDAFKQDHGLIEKALQDPRLENLRFEKYFQDLLRLENVSIPEMYRQMNSPPVPFDGEPESQPDNSKLDRDPVVP